MKYLYLSTLWVLCFYVELNAQCTPIDCSASLPPYGGICDTEYADGEVNQVYSDFESFVLTANCFDAGEIDPGNAGTEIYIVEVDNFSFSGLPAGITLTTDQNSYASMTGGPTLGCIAADGTPTEAGLFEATANFDAEVEAFIFGGCPTGFGVNTSASSSYAINFLVLPDASFSGLSGPYCEVDGDVTLMATGTVGGTFSGPGVSGNVFSPQSAGPGNHTIEYEVTAQEGSAIGPATNISTMTVIVDEGDEYYLDGDGDGYGDGSVIQLSCTGPPNGYTDDDTDCDDSDGSINPGETEICNGVDDNCDGDTDEGFDLDGDGVSSCNGDCNDNDDTVNPNAAELCNGIDDNCDGETDEGFDMDGDGFKTCEGDCDDNDPAINPGAEEACGGPDLNCDGLIMDDVQITIDEQICIGDTIIIAGQTVSVEGIYTYVLVAENGCDSIISLNLNFIGEEPFFTALASDTLCIAEPAIDLIGNVTPAGGSFTGNGIIGSSFDPSIAGAGIHQITYTTIDSFCTYSVSYDITVDLCTNTDDEFLSETSLNVYPNPASDFLILEFDKSIWDATSFSLFDLNGHQMFDRKIEQNSSVNQLIKIDVSDLPRGIYFLKVNELGISKTKKIQIIR